MILITIIEKEVLMPVYEFRCRKCGAVFEELRKTDDFTLPVCEQCGSSETEKKFSLFSGASGGKDAGSCSVKPGGG